MLKLINNLDASFRWHDMSPYPEFASVNGFINIIAELIALTHHDKKPKLDIDVSNVALLIN